MEAMRHENLKIQPLLKDLRKTDMVTGMFSVVVTCYEETAGQIVDAIESVLAQEYENKEIIVVFDKLDSDAHEVVSEKYADNELVSVHQHENLGSSGNKNFGMLLSRGEFIACFAGDMIMNYGAISNFVEIFNTNPDVAIVYTGYEFIRPSPTDRGMPAFASYPTDAKRITEVNAIDASMPQRFEKAVMFDDAFKSLGDWDWSITHLVHYGHKVFYTTNFLAYKHSIPPVTGLSSHSHQNWGVIIGHLCRKHNLVPFSERVNIFSNGVGHHGTRLAERTGWDCNENIVHKPYNYRKCLIVGFYHNNWQLYIDTIRNNPKTEFHVMFVGADIAALNYRTMNETRGINQFLTENKIKVYTESKRCQSELAVFGIKSKILSLPVERVKTYKHRHPFTVAVYMPNVPEHELEKYAIDFNMAISAKLPQINFLFYGNKYDEPKVINNVKVTGWTSMEEVISESDCLMRVLPFDGLSIAALEFLSAGKPVISNHKEPYFHHINCGLNFLYDMNDAHNAYNEIINTICKVRDGKLKSKPGFDISEFSLEKFKATIGEVA